MHFSFPKRPRNPPGSFIIEGRVRRNQIAVKDLPQAVENQRMNWSLRKQKRRPGHREQLEMLKKSRRFVGVQITTCGCPAVARHAGLLFSFRNAPSLPVQGCNAEACTCQYLGVTDRRRGIERRSQWKPDKNEKRRVERRIGPDVWKWGDR